MTYTIIDTSKRQGKPFYLYQFSNVAGTQRFTSSQDEITRLSHLWTPKVISHGKLEQNGNIEKQSLDIRFALSDEFAQTLLPVQNSPTTLTIYRGHHNDPDQEVETEWKGRIIGTKSGKQYIVATGETVFTSLRRSGCTARVQIQCRQALYQPGCFIDKDDFAVAAREDAA